MIFNYYQIKNLINGTIYIGITEKDPIIRYKQHYSQLQNNSHVNYLLQSDWNKYGEESFEFTLIESLDFENLDDAYNHEYQLIHNYSGELYNLAPGGQMNPMYSDSIRNKMITTKQSQVPDIYQLEEIKENTFKVIRCFKSQKEIQRITGYNQGNIGKGIKKHSHPYGYFWVNEQDIKNNLKDWRPYRIKFSPVALYSEEGEIIEVHHNAAVFEKKYGLKAGSISGSIHQNQRLFGKLYKHISEEKYYKLMPITLIF